MSAFDNFWLNEIKKASGASFVAWETTKDCLRLKLILNGEAKYLKLNGKIDGVTEDTYTSLLKEILE